MRSFYQRVAQAPVVLVSLLLVVVCMVAFAMWGNVALPRDAPNVIALQLAFSQEAFDAILDQWRADGVRYYQRSTLAIDYVFPVAYALLFSSLIALLGTRPGGEPSTLDLACFSVPLAAGMLDWLENTLHLVLLGGLLANGGPWILLASTAASIKWGLLGLSGVLVGWHLVRKVMRRFN